jgi:hypothetical protein
VGILRDMMTADAKNDVARYDAAFALGETSATLIELGELQAAETSLTESLSILSRAVGITAEELNDSKVLLGVNYYRLGVVFAARRNCAEANKWFALGSPIVTAAEGTDDSQWRTLSQETTNLMGQKASLCARPASQKPVNGGLEPAAPRTHTEATGVLRGPESEKAPS